MDCPPSWTLSLLKPILPHAISFVPPVELNSLKVLASLTLNSVEFVVVTTLVLDTVYGEVVVGIILVSLYFI